MTTRLLALVGGQRSPGVDPKQLAAELHKVSQQQAPGMMGAGLGGPTGLGVLSALERSAVVHSGTGSAASSGVPSPGQPASPAINKKQRHKVIEWKMKLHYGIWIILKRNCWGCNNLVGYIRTCLFLILQTHTYTH